MENEEGNNNGGNNGPPPPPPTNAELLRQLEELRRQVNREPAVPVQNQYVYHGVANPTVLNNIEANNFELKPGLIQMAENNAFRGKFSGDPNKHITKFIQICNTTKMNGVTDDQIRLRLFPFSLEDAAKDWLESLAPGSIRTWDQMVHKFVSVLRKKLWSVLRKAVNSRSFVSVLRKLSFGDPTTQLEGEC